MINRTKMPRQLRNEGGIMTIGGGGYTGIPMGSRTGFGIISKIKDRIRKLIPNELASVAVKAAPFVAPFNPAIAGLMRGIGRFDQRGSLSDAFKQGLATTAFGAGARTLGGATDIMGGGVKGGLTSPLSPDRTTAVKDFFTPGKEKDTDFIKEITGDTKKNVGLKSVKDATGLFKDVPILKDLPSIVQQQILVGGASGALTYIYQKFLADEPPQQEGETYEEYMTRRRENVGKKMKGYFDNYFKFDKEYSSMTDEQKQAFIDRVNVRDGGRIGYQTGGITMANTLAENIRRNLSNQAAINQRLQQARRNLEQQLPGRRAAQFQIEREANRIAAEELNRMTGGARGNPGGTSSGGLSSAPTINDIQAAIAANRNVNRIQTGPQPGELDPLGLPITSTIVGPLFGSGPQSLAEIEATRKRIEAAQAAMKPTYQEALMGESWETLSDNDQYRLAMEYPGETPPRRNPNFVPGLAKGGRVNFDEGGTGFMKWLKANYGLEVKDLDLEQYVKLSREFNNENPDPYETGRKKNAMGSMPVGIMRTNKAGVMERDYRDKGGFVPVGIKEKADDVPAMLSKNEFVFTADAVRGAGNGSIEKGAQRMYDTMKKLEKRVV